MKHGKWFWCLPSTLAILVIGYLAFHNQQQSQPDIDISPGVSDQTLELGALTSAATGREHRESAAIPSRQAAHAWATSPTDAEPAFAGFAAWAQRYLSADVAERAALEPEGVALAQARRTAMTSLIQTDPKRALELAVPEIAQSSFPSGVRSQLEEHVSARGDYDVLAAIPLPGEQLGVPPVQRSFKVGERRFEAFVYGHRVDAPTKRNLPLYGIALGKNMAVHENPVRVLSTTEVEQLQAAAVATGVRPSSGAAIGWRQNAKMSNLLNKKEVAAPEDGRTPVWALADEAICGVSGLAATVVNEPIAAELADEIVWLCRYDHVEFMNERLKLAAHKLAASAGDGSPEGETAESPYTEGRKRLIMIRVAFSNLPTPDISSNQLVTVHAGIDTYWRITSYGKTSVAELQRGSDIAQVTLPTTYQTYDGDAGLFRDDVRAAAVAAGIDFSKYDFDIIYSGGGRPSFSFGGLGYVGAPGSWVVGASRGITAHELGHNLGFPHANYWDTGGQSAIGPGANQEYGDPFDVMGGGNIDDGTGPGHYVSKFKWRIGWIPDVDFPRITASGTFRIYAHDNPDTRNLRGVRFRRDASLDYFLEFRQRYTSLPWMTNGIGLRWGSMSGSSSQLIDTTPGSADGKNDATILIGRTFSDPSAPVHITPLGLANTYPPSIDVRVNIGSFPGNQPPSFTLVPSTLASGVGGAVTFTANATDPNNDPLSYWWDFGNGTLSTENSPVVSFVWPAAGEYVVRCVVSDMKGGTTSDSVIVTIGRPAPPTYSIRGRILYNGQPVPDVFVRASSSRFAFTDSDGTYEITRLSAGTYAVTAQLYPYTFVSPFFSNPVTVGPADAENIDFLRVNAPQNDVTLIPNNAVWKYLDNGSNQGTNWSQPGFDDSLWASGPAELGYGDDDEATELSFGGNAANKYITYYFRRVINIADPTALTNYTLTLFHDDGGVAYVNGREVLRDNMPDIPITYTTLADDQDEEETAQAVISSSYFVPGPNVIAAEIHQGAPSSSDISFNLWMTATTATNFTGINAFYIAQPFQGATFTSPTNVNIVANGYTTSDSYSLVEFYANGSKVGESAAAPFQLDYVVPSNGVHRLTAVATLSGGAKLTSAPVHITVVAPVLTVTLIESNAVWRYNDEGQNLGTAWSGPAYSDVTWSNGLAQLGFGDVGLATLLRPDAAGPRTPTYYFRRAFTLEDAGLITDLVANLYRDDGAVLYLNGTEVSRILMSEGPFNFNSLATAAVDGNNEITPVVLKLPPALLVDGVNVLAAEVHQQSLSSSDLRFGLELIGTASGVPTPGVRITSPLDGTTNTVGDLITIAATAIGEDITTVEFYRDGALLGQDTTVPYQFDWLQNNPGAFNLTAVAREAGGGAFTSAPVQVTILAPRSGRQLVSARSLWRYLDDGSDPGVSWAQRLFNDSAWSQGYARLGYGGDGESTVVSFGPDPSRRYITTYFRHAFTVSNLAGVSGLKLLLSRDDGAVVYLNGSEIHRSNMRPGTVSYNSFAAGAVNAPDETAFFVARAPANNLLVGTNVVAVEVHQDILQGTDLGFDLELIAEVSTNLTDGVYLTSPAEGARITLPATVALSASAFSSAETVARVEFLVDGSSVGEDASFPYAVNWSAAGLGNHTLTAIAHLGSGAQLTSPPLNIIVQGPPITISPILSTYIPSGAVWKYWPGVVAPPIDWNSPDYDDAQWLQGPARLGFGLDGEATTLVSGRNSYYFRRVINVANPALIDVLIFQLQRDDGAVVYLNGVEVFRSNMPAGGITSSTPALADATGLDEQQFFITTVPASGLLPGANLVAVEVHQSSATSSDVGFNMHLSGSGDTSPRIQISRPGAGAQFIVGNPVTLEASAWPGQGRSVASVEFLVNGLLLQEVTSAPYIYDWNSPTQGIYTVVARMTDNFGQTLNSRTVNFRVGHQVVRTNFVAAGAIWKYLDNGSNQGTNFAQFSYNDSAWQSGPAQLGYGDGDEATTVGFGPSSSAKYITTYFRRGFQVPSGWIVTNLSFRLVRDDGAVVWLNGRELYRSNMLAGAFSYTTVASATVDGANESTAFESVFTFTNLPPTNLVAVEIHQRDPGSSDISFDLEVVGTGYVIAPPVLTVTRTEAGIHITWPASYTDWQLYYTSDVGSLSSGWVPSSATVTQSNGFNVVLLPPLNGSEFYQLRRP